MARKKDKSKDKAEIEKSEPETEAQIELPEENESSQEDTSDDLETDVEVEQTAHVESDAEDTVGSHQPEFVDSEEIEHLGSEPPQPDTPQRKTGFMPLVLGGVVSAAIGAGAVLYLLPNLPETWLPKSSTTTELEAALSAQAAEIEALRSKVAKAGETSALETSLTQTQGAVDTLAASIEKLQANLPEFNSLAERIATLEKAPLANAAPEAVEAYKREMAELNKALAQQRAEVEAMAAAAEEKKASAEMTAQDALKRSALSQILTSFETGSPFEDALADLSEVGVIVPDALVAQAKGVPSVEDLSDGFAASAREALAVARKAEGGTGLGAFLKAQLGARSIEPREGEDADAVLSRMEAAAREGRFGDVFAEAEALPEEAQSALQDWLDAARGRQEAVDAAETLSQQINSN